jgi:hypothetical protein
LGSAVAVSFAGLRRVFLIFPNIMMNLFHPEALLVRQYGGCVDMDRKSERLCSSAE